MKTITGKVSFMWLAYDVNDFYRTMDRNNIEVLNSKRNLMSYTFTVRGRDSDLDHARWFFLHGR